MSATRSGGRSRDGGGSSRGQERWGHAPAEGEDRQDRQRQGIEQHRPHRATEAGASAARPRPRPGVGGAERDSPQRGGRCAFDSVARSRSSQAPDPANPTVASSRNSLGASSTVGFYVVGVVHVPEADRATRSKSEFAQCSRLRSSLPRTARQARVVGNERDLVIQAEGRTSAGRANRAQAAVDDHILGVMVGLRYGWRRTKKR